MKQKQNIMLIILLIIFIVIILGISYAFLQTSFFASKDNTLKVGSLSLVLDESEGNAITVLSDGPLSDEEGLKLENYYSFKLVNNGKVASIYKIYLDDQPLDGSDIRIDQKYIHYSLEKNDSSSTAKVLSGDQKIASGIINSGETINYKLRLWFSSDMTAKEENKVFKAKLRIEGASTNEEVLSEKCKATGGDNYVDGECRKYYVMRNNIINMSNVDFSTDVHNYDENSQTWTVASEGVNKWFGKFIDVTDDSIKHVFYGLFHSSSPTFYGQVQYCHYNENAMYFELGTEKIAKDTYSYYYKLTNDVDIKPITSYDSYLLYNHFPTTSTLDQEYYLNKYMIVDLTLMFGEGNEPSKEWCDKNLTEYIEYNEAGVKIPISDVNYAGKTSYYDVIEIN